ncbi:hypothetical protein Efla_006400 [Eimeria flavescens]
MKAGPSVVEHPHPPKTGCSLAVDRTQLLVVAFGWLMDFRARTPCSLDEALLKAFVLGWQERIESGRARHSGYVYMGWQVEKARRAVRVKSLWPVRPQVSINATAPFISFSDLIAPNMLLASQRNRGEYCYSRAYKLDGAFRKSCGGSEVDRAMKRERHFQRSQAVASWEEKTAQLLTRRNKQVRMCTRKNASGTVAESLDVATLIDNRFPVECDICWHHSEVVANTAIQELTSSMVHSESMMNIA